MLHVYYISVKRESTCNKDISKSLLACCIEYSVISVYGFGTHSAMHAEMFLRGKKKQIRKKERYKSLEKRFEVTQQSLEKEEKGKKREGERREEGMERRGGEERTETKGGKIAVLGTSKSGPHFSVIWKHCSAGNLLLSRKAYM